VQEIEITFATPICIPKIVKSDAKSASAVKAVCSEHVFEWIHHRVEVEEGYS